jgi:hypothetical protein
MIDLVQCVACGKTVKSYRPERAFPMCGACAADRIADVTVEGTIAVPIHLLTYDPQDGVDHRAPLVKVVVRFEANEAVRVILGDEHHGPDVHIERHPRSWHVSFHPDVHDPIGTVEIEDTGEVRFVPDSVRGKEVVLA